MVVPFFKMLQFDILKNVGEIMVKFNELWSEFLGESACVRGQHRLKGFLTNGYLVFPAGSSRKFLIYAVLECTFPLRARYPLSEVLVKPVPKGDQIVDHVRCHASLLRKTLCNKSLDNHYGSEVLNPDNSHANLNGTASGQLSPRLEFRVIHVQQGNRPEPWGALVRIIGGKGGSKPSCETCQTFIPPEYIHIHTNIQYD